VVIVPAALLHTEPEVSPEDQPAARTHTGVHERSLHGETVAVALFPSLSEGRWTLWAEGPCATITLEILDGQVTEVDWR